MTVESSETDWPVPSDGSVGELVNRLCQHHAPALLSLADALYDQHPDAQATVVRRLAEACTAPLDGPEVSRREVRRRMAERIYARWSLHEQLPQATGHTAAKKVDRIVLALCMAGGHTYSQAAELVGIDSGHAAEALRSELRRVKLLTATPDDD